MTALVLTSENYRELKRALRGAFPKYGSSHLGEALAKALGYRSHAALVELLNRKEDTGFPEFALLDEAAFKTRLIDLGSTTAHDIKSGLFSTLDFPKSSSVLVSTTPPSAAKVKYRTARDQAWRNMMVAAVNAGLEQRLFSLKPGDNRWPENPDPRGQKSGHVYRFNFANDIPAVGFVNDAGFDELSIHVAVWPTEDGEKRVRAINAGFWAGEAYASSWVERRNGAWLQTNTKSLSCRKARINQLADKHQVPRGFGDREKMGSITFR